MSVSVSDGAAELLPLDEKTARTIKKAIVAVDTDKDNLIIKTGALYTRRMLQALPPLPS